MAIGKITGQMLNSNLDRTGVGDLAFNTNLVYLSTSLRFVGINNSTPNYTLDSPGNARLANILITGNSITSNSGAINFGSISNVSITGGSQYNIISTDGAGTLSLIDANTLPAIQSLIANVNTTNALINADNLSLIANVNAANIAIATTQANIGAYQIYANANIGTLYSGNIITQANLGTLYLGNITTQANLGAYQTYANANIGTLYSGNIITQANLGTLYLGNITTQANLGAYQTYANANIGTLYSANITTQANIGTLYLGNITTQANLGAYQTYANANIGTLYLGNITTQANLGAYQTYANAAIVAINSNAASQLGNTLQLGANSVASFVSNAVTLTSSTTVTNALAELNYVLGKLVPQSPPNFPNSINLSLTSSTTTGLMTNFTQTDNSGWGNLSVTGGTSVSAVRTATLTTSGPTNVGPGSTGTVTAYINGTPNGNVTLTGSNSNTTNGNLYVYNVEDYQNIVSTVTAGFWTVFSTYAIATGGIPAGWNRVYIADTGTGTQTNNLTWYYDSSVPGTPTFSNTSITLTSNTVQYSSTIPHFTTSATFRIKGNVANLSGDLYAASPFSTGSGGALATPTTPTYSSFSPSVSTPLSRNLSATQYFETSVSITSGFGSSAGGPSVSFTSPYASGSSGAITPGVTVLYKTGTATNIEETSIPVTVATGGTGVRIVNMDAGTAADNPAYTGTEAVFSGTTGAFYATDATNIAATIRWDATNYSTGYLPVGPNLSSRSGAQYFTFRFIGTSVSKFNVSLTTNGSTAGIAGLWVAAPGTSIDTTASPTNGWISGTATYAGSGVPGTGTGGNGSSGCAVGGNIPVNTQISSGSYTMTFGTVNTSSSANHYVYVRIKLNSGQQISVLSIAPATN